MGRAVLNGFLLLAVVVSVVASWIFSSDPTRPNFEFLPQMAHSPRYNAFAPNPNFADGSTLQRSEPGTIARGSMPLHYAATPQDALRAGEELKSPLDLSNVRARERGAFVFSNFCAVCHGAGGAGNGPVAQRGYPPPPSLLWSEQYAVLRQSAFPRGPLECDPVRANDAGGCHAGSSASCLFHSPTEDCGN